MTREVGVMASLTARKVGPDGHGELLQFDLG